MAECRTSYLSDPSSWMPESSTIGTIKPAFCQVFPDSSMAVFFSDHPTFAVFYDQTGIPVKILLIEEFAE